MPERTQCSEPFEREFRPLPAAHRGRDVDRGNRGLADGMLCRRRNRRAGHGPDRCAVAQGPDFAFVMLQLEAGIDQKLAAFFGASELLDHRRKHRRDRGDQGLAGNLDARLQDRFFRGSRLQPVIQNDFNAASLQNSLGEDRQRLRHIRQNSTTSLNNHATQRFVAQMKIIPLDGVHRIVQLGHYFDAREAASSDDEGQELAAQFRFSSTSASSRT
jgi:hypothetical protein